jgi:hypothetical protein
MQNIHVELIQASVGPNGIPIHTFRMTYPRFIHAECKTHRLLKIDDENWIVEQELALMDDVNLSRNAASSRAIPVEKMLEQITNQPAMPVHWGKNQSGMQAREELSPEEASAAEVWWRQGAQLMVDHVRNCPVPLHKQVINRPLETWMLMTVVVTATDWNNWRALRAHPDAQPEIYELAKQVVELLDNTEPFQLRAGDLHVPFVERQREPEGYLHYFIVENDGTRVYLNSDQVLQVSASCSAQTSFRALDFSLDKAQRIYKKLVEDRPVHASPFEHQAIALFSDEDIKVRTINGICGGLEFPEGITHIDRNLELWSGNLRGWVQHRQLINGHHVPG